MLHADAEFAGLLFLGCVQKSSSVLFLKRNDDVGRGMIDPSLENRWHRLSVKLSSSDRTHNPSEAVDENVFWVVLCLIQLASFPFAVTCGTVCRTASDGYDKCAALVMVLIVGALCTEINKNPGHQSGMRDSTISWCITGLSRSPSSLFSVFFFSRLGCQEHFVGGCCTPLGATAVVTPGSAGYLLWECCILASL